MRDEQVLYLDMCYWDGWERKEGLQGVQVTGQVSEAEGKTGKTGYPEYMGGWLLVGWQAGGIWAMVPYGCMASMASMGMGERETREWGEGG